MALKPFNVVTVDSDSEDESRMARKLLIEYSSTTGSEADLPEEESDEEIQLHFDGMVLPKIDLLKVRTE